MTAPADVDEAAREIDLAEMRRMVGTTGLVIPHYRVAELLDEIERLRQRDTAADAVTALLLPFAQKLPAATDDGVFLMWCLPDQEPVFAGFTVGDVRRAFAWALARSELRQSEHRQKRETEG